MNGEASLPAPRPVEKDRNPGTGLFTKKLCMAVMLVWEILLTSRPAKSVNVQVLEALNSYQL